jgi:stage II sporulation protein D
MADEKHTSQVEAIEDSELAAALAAIQAFLEEEEAEAGEEESSCHAWSMAARLEGLSPVARRLAQPLPKAVISSPWKALSLKFLPFFLLAVLASSPQSIAENVLVNPQVDGHHDRAGNPVSWQPSDGAPLPAAIEQMTDKKVILRVALLLSVNTLTVELPDGAEIQDADSGATLATAPAGASCTFSLTGAIGFQGRDGRATPISASVNAAADAPTGGRSLSAQSFLVKPIGEDSVIGVNGKLYRGTLAIKPVSATANALNAINNIDLEEYLYSVVPAEMPTGWPAEALKAQAVAARSYAIANLGKHERDGYDLKATTEDQVYSGVSSESSATNSAVAATAGLVLKHDGCVVPAFFHSTSGGYTEVAENVWGSSASFLKSVPDYDDKSPMFSWSQKFTVASLEESLRKGGCEVGALLGLYVLARTPSMRAQYVLAVGNSLAKLMSGNDLRRMLNLPSTNFNVCSLPQSYVFVGRGSGHGLGLSQWGAKTLAENGYNAAQILTYYYKDVSLGYF